MSHDHVGIPKFIERGFAINESVWVYDLIREKKYKTSIDRLGTENKYYDEDVEKTILAGGIESNFSSFYNNFCGTTDINLMKELLITNRSLVEQFFSFMFLRAKKVLEQINEDSVATKIIGDFDHSQLLRIQNKIGANPLSIIGEKYFFYPLINFSERLFINNSIGFGLIINNNKKYSFVIPLTYRVAILISGNEQLDQHNVYCIEPNRNDKADSINKTIVKTEKAMGNGFFFGLYEDDIVYYSDYLKDLISIEKAQ